MVTKPAMKVAVALLLLLLIATAEAVMTAAVGLSAGVKMAGIGTRQLRDYFAQFTAKVATYSAWCGGAVAAGSP